MLQTLSILKDEKNKRREPALLFDLWLNAERRAAQGRFDDAIARWYRLMEWTAQWQLKTKLDADTADFPPDLLPEDADATPGRDGKIKIGLWQAWQVLGERLTGTRSRLRPKARKGDTPSSAASQRVDTGSRFSPSKWFRLARGV